jgi:hypothetical protein
MTHQNELPATPDNRLDRWQSHANPPIVSNPALIIQRDIKVHTHEYRLSAHIHIGNRFLGHSCDP